MWYFSIVVNPKLMQIWICSVFDFKRSSYSFKCFWKSWVEYFDTIILEYFDLFHCHLERNPAFFIVFSRCRIRRWESCTWYWWRRRSLRGARGSPESLGWGRQGSRETSGGSRCRRRSWLQREVNPKSCPHLVSRFVDFFESKVERKRKQIEEKNLVMSLA